MGEYINKKVQIDAETGEIMNEKYWLGYDGFSEKGYKYRNRAVHIRYYFDSLPDNYDESTWTLLFLIAELMTEENMLVYRVKRKSKFSNIIYKPMDKEYIKEHIRFKYGRHRFDRCWSVLRKSALKQIRYHQYLCWAVNPSIISKCRDVPYWLYDAFKEYMNPHLSAKAVQKLNRKVKELYADDLESDIFDE